MTPMRAPLRSNNAFVPTVVPWTIVALAVSPPSVAKPLRNPAASAPRFDGVFAVRKVRVCALNKKKSVNVPPISTPSMDSETFIGAPPAIENDVPSWLARRQRQKLKSPRHIFLGRWHRKYNQGAYRVRLFRDPAPADRHIRHRQAFQDERARPLRCERQ